jgi:hypothetical protein
MECSFIDKYIDKIYCGSMSFFDNRLLEKHMNTCESCRSVYESIAEEDFKIRESVMCSDVPTRVGISVMKSIDTHRYKHRRIAGIKKYLSAAVILVLLVSSALYYMSYSGKLNTSGTPPKPEQTAEVESRQELEKVLKQYIKEQIGKTSNGGQLFTALDIFGIKESSSSPNLREVYLWALVEEYSWVQGLMKGSVSSLAMIVHVEKIGNSYKPVLYHTEFNSSMDVKTLGDDYREQLSIRRLDVSDLDAQIKTEAMEYYKEYHTPSQGTESQKSARTLVEKFGWAWANDQAILKLKIPSSFVDKPGEYPLGLYWAYANVLSKDIGLDMTKYKGSEVNAHIMSLIDLFGDTPNKEVRAVVIEKDGLIVGAWIDKGRSGGPWASLKKNYFDALAGKSWGQWLTDEGIEDNVKGCEAGLKNLTPEQVIEKYFEAVDKQDQKAAFSLLSKANQLGYMWINLEDGLYNDTIVTDGQETQKARITEMEKWANLDIPAYKESIKDKLKNRQISDVIEFNVTLDMDFKNNIVSDDGINTRFVTLVKETPDSPWKIDGIGTGP